jgi:hypothetical protein
MLVIDADMLDGSAMHTMGSTNAIVSATARIATGRELHMRFNILLMRRDAPSML